MKVQDGIEIFNHTLEFIIWFTAVDRKFIVQVK
jgi:hypothetical protein